MNAAISQNVGVLRDRIILRSAAALHDPLLGSNWTFDVDIGREPGTWMPQRWGYDDKRFAFRLDNVRLTPEPVAPGREHPFFRRENWLSGLWDRTESTSPYSMVLEPKAKVGSHSILCLRSQKIFDVVLFVTHQVRNFPRLRVDDGAWQRVGPVAEGR